MPRRGADPDRRRRLPGRRLAAEMTEHGHALRITTRTEASRAAIEATGAECWIGTPDRLATLRGRSGERHDRLLAARARRAPRSRSWALHGLVAWSSSSRRRSTRPCAASSTRPAGTTFRAPRPSPGRADRAGARGAQRDPRGRSAAGRGPPRRADPGAWQAEAAAPSPWLAARRPTWRCRSSPRAFGPMMHTMAGDRPRYGPMVSALGAIVLAVSVFLPWYGVSFTAHGIAFAQQLGSQVAPQFGNATLQATSATLHTRLQRPGGHELPRERPPGAQGPERRAAARRCSRGPGRAARPRRPRLRPREPVLRWRCSAPSPRCACSTGSSIPPRASGNLLASRCARAPGWRCSARWR